jgi:hypothetical protein
LPFGWVSSVLAHDPAHSVPGITLPPGDANFLIFSLPALGSSGVVKKGYSLVIRWRSVWSGVQNVGPTIVECRSKSDVFSRLESC